MPEGMRPYRSARIITSRFKVELDMSRLQPPYDADPLGNSMSKVKITKPVSVEPPESHDTSNGYRPTT